jgi:hypothetical protein
VWVRIHIEHFGNMPNPTVSDTPVISLRTTFDVSVDDDDDHAGGRKTDK